METVKHEIPPVYDKNSKILILGSFPSVKSVSYTHLDVYKRQKLYLSKLLYIYI